MNAAELLLAGADAAPALIEARGNLSYAELRRDVMRAAGTWQALGLRTGQRCIVALADGSDWVTAFLGAIWLGAQPIAISPRTEIAQIAELIADADASAALLEDDVAAALGDHRALGRSAWSMRYATTTQLPQAHAAAADDPAFWLYSSGTTGKPKGIPHAHRCALHAAAFAQEVLGANATDRFYSTSKLFFAYPLANALFAGLRLGASVVLDAEWPNPERVAENLERYQPTVFFSVPTLYRRLTEAQLSFASVRRAVSAGESCPADVAERWRELTGVPLVNGYGTTETLSLMLYKTEDMAGFRPTPLTTATVDADEAKRDGALRLWFSHPAVALGYSRAVVGDSACFGERGFSPGDLFRPLGTQADAGWNFAGRSDQLLKVFGRWVDTLALEQKIATALHGKLRELCIVPHSGDNADTISLHLFAIAHEGDAAGARAAIAQTIAELPGYQQPSGIHLVPDLPRTETGKLRRGVLGKMLAAGEY